MFNDLNGQQNNQKPVDDIFAETDKPNNNSNGSRPDNIETHRVGLASLNDGSPLAAPDNNVQKNSIPWFKIVAIVIIAAIVILSGYLVYSKFFKPATNVALVKTVTQNSTTTTTQITTDTSVSQSPTTNTQVPVNSSSTIETPNSANTTVSPIESSTSAVASTSAASMIDSDSDGLTDAEEAIYGTNPLVADTDGDGLSDYDEVKIYHTNPLVVDTDGDGYPDGVEVKSGHNPNGPGMMPGLATSSATVK